MGLKLLRSFNGPVAPNKFHNREPAKRCYCGLKIRSPHHEQGQHHLREVARKSKLSA